MHKTFIPVLSPVEVGWEHVDYSVAEDGGAVELCVMAVAAQLSRDVVVNVTFGRSEGMELFINYCSHLTTPCLSYLALPPSPSLLPPLSPVSPLPLTPHPSPPPSPLPSHTHTDSASRTDYTAVDTELTFQQGGSRRLCTSVPIVNDNIVENNETLTVTLSTKNASVTSPTATVTILDDIDGMYILLCMLCVHACKLLSFSTLSLSLPPSLPLSMDSLSSSFSALYQAAYSSNKHCRRLWSSVALHFNCRRKREEFQCWIQIQ